jgi:inhibitor of cysteine peptidase
MERFFDPSEPIHVELNERFAISLAGNPTTGYTWQADVDSRYLVFLGQEFEPRTEAPGAGGREVFQFEAQRTGTTQVVFEYRRPWGGPARDKKNCQVLIDR